MNQLKSDFLTSLFPSSWFFIDGNVNVVKHFSKLGDPCDEGLPLLRSGLVLPQPGFPRPSLPYRVDRQDVAAVEELVPFPSTCVVAAAVDGA